MPIFGDLSYSQPRPLYVGQPIEEVKALQESADRNYQQNRGMADQLDIMAQNLDFRAQDYEVKKSLIDGLRSNLKQVADSGRWEMASNNVRQAAKDFATNPLGNAALDKRKQEIASQQALAARDKVTGEDKQKAAYLNYVSNNKKTTLDPITGHDVNPYSPVNVPDSVDKAELIKKFLDGHKDDGGLVTIRDAAGNVRLQVRDLGAGQYEGVGEWAGTSPERATRMALEYAMQQPQIRDALRFEKQYQDARTFGEQNGKPMFDASGNLQMRPVTDTDIMNLNPNLTISDDKVGQWTKVKGVRKFIPAPIYNGSNFDPNKATALYNSMWNSKHVNEAVNPAADWLAHYKEEWKWHEDKDYADKHKKPPQIPITITNEGQLSGGTPTSIDALRSSALDINQKLATVDRTPGNAYEKKANRDFLQTQKDVVDAQTTSTMNNYLASPEGIAAFKYIQDKYPNVKKEDLYDLTAEHGFVRSTDIPFPMLSGVPYLKNISIPIGVGGAPAHLERFREDAIKYAEAHPVASSARVVKGEKGSFADRFGDITTDLFMQDGSNYVVNDPEKGMMQADEFKNSNLSKGSKVRLEPLSGYINGKFGQALTVIDANGNPIKHAIAYPKDGETQLPTLAHGLIEENKLHEGETGDAMTPLRGENLMLGYKAAASYTFKGLDNVEVELAHVNPTSNTNATAGKTFGGKDGTPALIPGVNPIRIIKSKDSESTGVAGKKEDNVNWRAYFVDPVSGETTQEIGMVGEKEGVPIPARNLEELKVAMYRNLREAKLVQ